MAEAAAVMMKGHVGALIVMDGFKPVGIVTERDIVHKVVSYKRSPAEVRVSEIMSAPLIVVTPENELTTAAALMVENRIRRVVVTEDNKLVGILACTDLAKYLWKKARENKLLQAITREGG